MNLEELSKTINEVTKLVIDHGERLEDVKVNFETFDENFDINSDDFQRPTEITSVHLDILQFNEVTIRIETK